MRFFKKHWQSMVITIIVFAILYREYQMMSSQYYLLARWREASSIQNPFFVATGKWGIRFLLLSLSMSPIYTFTGWRFPLTLRKPLGLTAFFFVSIHAGMHLSSKWSDVENYDLWFRLTNPDFVLYGAIAYFILLLMAITSIKPTMKLAGRFWKPLHRLVYGASLLMMYHSIVASSYGKRLMMGGKESLAELQIYLVIMVCLLIVRIPPVKHALQTVLPFSPKPRKSKPKRSFA